MNLIMYEPNVYVNNSKFISIVDNVSVHQFRTLGALFVPPKIYPGLTVFNNIVGDFNKEYKII